MSTPLHIHCFDSYGLTMLFQTKNGNGNILTFDRLRLVRQVELAIQNIDHNPDFQDVCARPRGNTVRMDDFCILLDLLQQMSL